MRDFFISYNGADRDWALWIAWQLEDAGYTTIIQEWDITPGSDFIMKMHLAALSCERTLAVLSESYFSALYTYPEWTAAYAADPTGEKGLLVPVQVLQCKLEGIWRTRVYINLVGADDEAKAKEFLITRVRSLPSVEARLHLEAPSPSKRLKPLTPPPFPPTQQRVVTRLHNLPAQRNKFVGREKDLDDISGLVSKQPLLTLAGAGGVGKTRLALEVATRVLDKFSDGVWFVNLATLSESDGGLIEQEIARELSVAEEPDSPLIETLIRHLQPKHLLLILDNCEHLVMACAKLVEKLLGGCPRLRVMTTGREPLGLEWESVLPVPPLSAPDPLEMPASGRVAYVRGFEAVILFEDRAVLARQNPAFTVTEENALPLAHVCHRVDGLPFAIEIAAGRIYDLVTVENIVKLMDEAGSFPVLSKGFRTASENKQTMEATLEWSYKLLDEPERLLFDRLSVFAGGWSLAAAAAICRGGDIAPGQVLNLLSGLVYKSLVQADLYEKEPRYKLFQLTREYGLLQLERSGEAPAIRRAHAEYFLRLAEEAEPELIDAEQGLWLARLNADLDNLRAALAWSKTTADGGELGLRLAAALPRFWMKRGFISEGLSQLEAMLSASRGATPLYRAKANYGAGWLAVGLYEHQRAEAFLRESLKLYQEVGDKTGVAWSFRDLGNVARERGDTVKAKENLEQSLTLFRELDDKRGIAWTLHDLVNIARGDGDYEAAISYCEESIAIFDSLSDIWAVAWGLHKLGNVAKDQHQYEQAAALYDKSRLLFLDLKDRRGLAWSFDSLGAVARLRSDYKAATSHYEESLTLFRRLGDKRGLAWTLHNLGNVALDRGEPAKARELLQQSLDMFRSLDDERGAGWTLHNLGVIARREGAHALSASLHRESINLFKKRNDKAGIASAYHNLGETLSQQGNTREALECFEESVNTFRTLKDKCGLAWVLRSLGHLRGQRGDYAMARSICGESLKLFEELSIPRGIAWALFDLANAERYGGHYEEARANYQRSLTLFEELNDTPAVAWALSGQGDVARYQGLYHEAKALYERSLPLFKEMGDRRAIAWTTRNLSNIARLQGDPQSASLLLEESLGIFRALTDAAGTAAVLHDLATLAREQGNYNRAISLYQESLTLFGSYEDKRGVASAIHNLGRIALAQGNYERAAKLLGKADALRRDLQSPLTASELVDNNKEMAHLRASLGEEAFNAKWAEGQAMTLEEANSISMQPSA